MRPLNFTTNNCDVNATVIDVTYIIDRILNRSGLGVRKRRAANWRDRKLLRKIYRDWAAENIIERLLKG